MRTLFKNSIAASLLFALCGYGSAETLIQDVSKEQAEKMGVTISARTNGDAGIKVSLELKAQGKWEKFRQVELRMTSAGKHLASAPLQVFRPTAKSISTNFSVESSTLNDCEFWVYVDDIPLGGSAYRFQVEDFVNVEKLSKRIPKPASKGLTTPEDHQIDGYAVFHQLEGKVAKSHGESLAKSDHQNGIKRIFVYGLRGGPSEYEKVLAERYQVYHVPIAGCIVSDGIIEGARSYNNTMRTLLFDLYKRDIFEEVRTEIKESQSQLNHTKGLRPTRP